MALATAVVADEKGRRARQYPVARGAFVSAAEPLPPETGFWYLEAAPA